jgi:hypothetical protein
LANGPAALAAVQANGLMLLAALSVIRLFWTVERLS